MPIPQYSPPNIFWIFTILMPKGLFAIEYGIQSMINFNKGEMHIGLVNFMLFARF